MTRGVRLGAVSYLNVRPLVYGLDAQPAVSLRFDVPAECARLLAAGTIDLGMVPSITYLDRPGDRIVPGIAIASDGPVASVALFSRRPLNEVRTIALDSSSRTSAILVKILCHRVFGIAPVFVPHGPDPAAMLAAADAALLIGDPALFLDHLALGAEKWDLGALWTERTGLPFVWAFWAGGPDAADPGVVAMLQRAASEGRRNLPAIAARYCAGTHWDPSIASAYLRTNLVFSLDDRAVRGLRTYYDEAEALGLAGPVSPVAFFAGPDAAHEAAS